VQHLRIVAMPVLADKEGLTMARRWSAVLARTGVPTGDGRILVEGAGTSRDLPLPLLYQRETDDGHGGSIVVGRIETMTFANGMITATGSLLDEAGGSALESIEAGVIGPSVDLDDIEYVMDDADNLVITRWRVAGATLVAIPAFAGVSITLDAAPAEEPMWAEYSAGLMTFATQTRERMQATQVLPPIDWFKRPDVDELTPLTVSDSGRVFGHIAPWGECHVGLPGCVTAPNSLSGYSHFMVGSQRTSEGRDVPVGSLVTGPRHADPQMAFRAAQQHYDDIGAAVARVTAGEDQFGIWVAGWMLPNADPVRVEQFMASPVSGDWRRVGGSLEMIAVCSVNAPGFPVPRARVSFASGAQQALIGSFGVKAVRGDVDAVRGDGLGVQQSVQLAEADAQDAVAVASVTAARARWARDEWARKGN
jgi:hypothetical protein